MISPWLAPLLASLVTAQSIDLPSCAQTCVSNIYSAHPSGCSQLDLTCICSSKAVLSDLTCCLAKDCDESEIVQAFNVAQQICAAQEVSLTLTACTSTKTTHSSTSTRASSNQQPAAATGSGSSVPAGNDHETLAIGLGVGLGVGIPLVLCAFAYLLFLVWRTKRRERQSASQDSTGETKFEGYQKAELPVGEQRHEVAGTEPSRFEMP